MSAPTTLDEWADSYGQLRAAEAGNVAAWISIPVLTASVVGLLWSVPLPESLREAAPVLNWATMFLMAAFVYYCILSIRIALAGLLFLAVAAAPSFWLELEGLPSWQIALGAFLPAFAWQLVDTRRATGHARVIRNLQYLMLGPVWLLRAAFRRAGLGY